MKDDPTSLKTQKVDPATVEHARAVGNAAVGNASTVDDVHANDRR